MFRNNSPERRSSWIRNDLPSWRRVTLLVPASLCGRQPIEFGEVVQPTTFPSWEFLPVPVGDRGVSVLAVVAVLVGQCSRIDVPGRVACHIRCSGSECSLAGIAGRGAVHRERRVDLSMEHPGLDLLAPEPSFPLLDIFPEGEVVG